LISDTLPGDQEGLVPIGANLSLLPTEQSCLFARRRAAIMLASFAAVLGFRFSHAAKARKRTA
jgi:hypothetical protein